MPMDAYTVLLYVGVILFFGFAFGKAFERMRLPDVTGYIVAGVVIGPYALNLIDMSALAPLSVITNIVLGIIAYQIGTELFIPVIRRNAGAIVTITMVHALITAAVVFFGVFVIFREWWLAFALSGLAVASAPAPVMQVIKKLKAKGPVKSTVIPVVGLLDIVAVIVFALFASIAVSLVDGSPISVQNAIVTPFYEVSVSVGIGAVMGLVLALVSRWIIERLPKQERYLSYLALIMAFVLGSVWVAERHHLSLILIPLSMGMAFTNFIDKETFTIQNAALNNFGGPFIVLFFTIAGLGLSPGLMVSAGLLAIVFIALRLVGKVLGSHLGASLTTCSPNVKRYTGWCLLPQAGVTIGMLVALSAMLPERETQLIQTVVLSSILIFQIIGPIVMQHSLIKAGEARLESPITN